MYLSPRHLLDNTPHIHTHTRAPRTTLQRRTILVTGPSHILLRHRQPQRKTRSRFSASSIYHSLHMLLFAIFANNKLLSAISLAINTSMFCFPDAFPAEGSSHALFLTRCLKCKHRIFVKPITGYDSDAHFGHCEQIKASQSR